VSANWFLRTTDTYATWTFRDATSVSQDFSATYAIVAPAVQDFTASYYIAEPAISDFLVRYDIAILGTWATLEINGTVGLVAERLFVAEYDILDTAIQDFSASYLIDGTAPPAPYPVYQDYSLIYSIDATPTTFEVYQDFDARWKMDGVVITDFESYYALNGEVSYADWVEEDSPTDTWTPRPSVNGTWTPAAGNTTTWN
jgi:hypothetical protein